jgi:hypothetical protein
MTTAIRRRPRRSNSLKDIGRLLGMAEPAHEESRRDRLLAKARRMSDTVPNARRNYFNIQTANLFLRQFGVTLIANDRVFHIWEDWPGAVGAAWLDDGPAGDALRQIKTQALDRGAPAPLARQGSREKRSAQLGGATAQEKRLATLSREKENAAIVALRDADHAFLAACEAAERLRIYRAGLMKEPMVNSHDQEPPWQELVANAVVSEVNGSELLVNVRKPVVRGVYDDTPGGNDKKFNPLGLDAVADYEPWGEDGEE